MSPSTTDPLSRLLVIAAIVCAGYLQLSASVNPYYGYDEAWHLYLSSVSPLWKALEEMAVDPHPPLYYLLLRPFVAAGAEPFWPRLLSVVPALLTIPSWYALLLKLKIARGVALTLTLILAGAYSFNELSVTVRAYSLAAFCLVGALWFWSDFLPGTRGRASRASLDAFLALATAAFWLSYAAVFFVAALIGATLLVSLADPSTRALLRMSWRVHFRWPERFAFFGAHLVAVTWFLAGYGRGGVAAPPHVSPYLFGDDLPVGQYLLDGLRAYMELFTPLSELGRNAQTIGLVTLAISLTILFLVTTHRGQTARSALLLVIPLALLVVAISGLSGFYPFGGYLRHQYFFLPFLLLALAFAFDLVYARLSSGKLRAAACALVLGIALWSSARAWHAQPFGEAPRAQPLSDEIVAVFGADVEPEAVYMTVYPFYIIYAERFEKGIVYRDSYGHDENGWTSISGIENPIVGLSIRREWDEYMVSMDSGETIPLFRDRTLFRFPEALDESFFDRLRELMEMRNLPRIRILRHHSEALSMTSCSDLTSLFSRHGFALSNCQSSTNGATWLVEPGSHQFAYRNRYSSGAVSSGI